MPQLFYTYCEVIPLTPLVSVVMSAYNHKNFVAAAIDSVLGQTFTDFEFLIADDHSTDGTDDIIRRYTDARIAATFQSENTNGCSAFLRAKAVGKYIAIIHSDDVWLPDKLKKQVGYMEAHPDCAACFTHAALIDESGSLHAQFDMKENIFRQPNRTQAEWLRHFFTKSNCLCHPSILANREIYSNLESNRTLRQLPDFHKWISLIKQHPIYIIQEDLTLHRRLLGGKDNMSAPKPENSLRSMTELFCLSETFFDDLSDELFIEAFRALFRDPNAHSPAELLCEKFFLLLDHWVFGGAQRKLSAAVFFYKNCGANADVLLTLQDHYGYTLQDFYALTGSINLNWLNTAPAYTEERYLEAVDQAEKAKARLAAAEKAYAAIAGSTSWKVTKPLRLILDFVKKRFGKGGR
ncbi:MAG: glycosyltransferase [Clostridiaceae bacterium]